MARDLSANLIPALVSRFFFVMPEALEGNTIKRAPTMTRSGLNSICIEFLFSDKNHIYYKPLEVFLTIFIKR
jgi:hypothetical protein